MVDKISVTTVAMKQLFVFFIRQSDLLAQELESFAGTGEFDPEEMLTKNMLETTCRKYKDTQ